MEFGGWSLPPWPKSLIVIDFLAQLAAFFTRSVDTCAPRSEDYRLRLSTAAEKKWCGPSRHPSPKKCVCISLHPHEARDRTKVFRKIGQPDPPPLILAVETTGGVRRGGGDHRLGLPWRVVVAAVTATMPRRGRDREPRPDASAGWWLDTLLKPAHEEWTIWLPPFAGRGPRRRVPFLP